MNDPKYDFKDHRIYVRGKNEPIPEDEPVMVFRAKDKFALKALKAYLNAIIDDLDVPEDHIDAVEWRLKAFREFARHEAARMGTPDTERGVQT